MKRIHLVPVAVLAGIALAACGSSGSSGKSGGGGGSSPPASLTAPVGGSTAPASVNPTSLPTSPGSLTIGSADFPENELLMDIYGDAMSAKGVKVSKHPNIGERPAYIAALGDNSIDAIPEYSGSILDYFDNKATAKTPEEVSAALKKVAASKGLIALNPAAAQDSDTITVTKETAQKYHLSSIADLKAVASKLTFGAPAQFKTRPDGIPALKSVYGVTFGTFTPLRAGGTFTVNALKSGSIDAGDIFSTDPSIIKNGFVALKDPKSMFAAQNIVPLISQKKLTQPMLDACNAVSAKLDTATLAQLVVKVSGGADADTVAKGWLKTAGLG